MHANPTGDTKKILTEIGTLLDALSILSVELSCECGIPDRLILPATRVREACAAIDEAVPTLKHLLSAIQARGHEALPPAASDETRPD